MNEFSSSPLQLEHNHLEDFLLDKVSSGSFHVDHIASQLFWDVVKFNKCLNMCSMRFTKMYNNSGQLVQERNTERRLKTDLSQHKK